MLITQDGPKLFSTIQNFQDLTNQSLKSHGMANTLQKKHASITHLSLCIWCHFILGRIFFIFLPDFEHLQERLKFLGKHGLLFSGKAQTRSANSRITKNGKLFSLCTMYVKVRFRLIWSIIALSINNFLLHFLLTTFRTVPRFTDNLTIYLYQHHYYTMHYTLD